MSIKTLKPALMSFLDSKKIPKAKGYYYLITILGTFSTETLLQTDITKIYETVAHKHCTTIASVEANIRYVKNHTENYTQYTNKELIKNLSLEYYETTKLNKTNSTLEW